MKSYLIWINFVILVKIYHILQNFDGGNSDIFPARPSKFNPSNCLKTIPCLQVYGEIQ